MNKKWWLIAIVFCLVIVTVSPLASSAPDGLEKVAEDKGFIDTAEEAPFEIVADYIFPRIENEALATILAGWLGILVLFFGGYSFVFGLVAETYLLSKHFYLFSGILNQTALRRKFCEQFFFIELQFD